MKNSIRELIEWKTGRVAARPPTEKQNAYHEKRRQENASMAFEKGAAEPQREQPKETFDMEESSRVQTGQSQGQGMVNMTFEQLQALMASIATNIVTELKKPTPEEAAKLAADKALLERRRTEMVRIAKEETARLEDFQRRCPHLKENGKPATGGQLYSNGHVNMFCLRCGKVVEDYIPGQQDMANGFGNVADDFAGVGQVPQSLM